MKSSSALQHFLQSKQEYDATEVKLNIFAFKGAISWIIMQNYPWSWNKHVMCIIYTVYNTEYFWRIMQHYSIEPN